MLVSWFWGKAAKCLLDPPGSLSLHRSQEKKAESEKDHWWGSSKSVQSAGTAACRDISFPHQEDRFFSRAGPANTSTS